MGRQRRFLRAELSSRPLLLILCQAYLFLSHLTIRSFDRTKQEGGKLRKRISSIGKLLRLSFREVTEEEPLRHAQFALVTKVMSSRRTKPVGLLRFDLTSSQSPRDLTTLTRVPLLICDKTFEEAEGSW